MLSSLPDSPRRLFSEALIPNPSLSNARKPLRREGELKRFCVQLWFLMEVQVSHGCALMSPALLTILSRSEQLLENVNNHQ